MRVPSPYVIFAQLGEHGAGVHAETFTDPCERESRLIEANHLVDLRSGRRCASKDDTSPFQDSADRDAMTAVLGGKFVDGLARLIGGDDLADLLIRESRLRRALTTSVLLRKLADWIG